MNYGLPKNYWKERDPQGRYIFKARSRPDPND